MTVEDTFIRDVKNTFKSARGDKVVCRCCSKTYERGDWNFYNLCDTCFKVFDVQRMGKYDQGTGSIDGFIDAKVCPHK